jgi:hypothetical protein
VHASAISNLVCQARLTVTSTDVYCCLSCSSNAHTHYVHAFYYCAAAASSIKIDHSANITTASLLCTTTNGMPVMQAAAGAASKDTSRSGMLAELRNRMSQQRTLWGVAPPLMKDLGLLLTAALNEVSYSITLHTMCALLSAMQSTFHSLGLVRVASCAVNSSITLATRVGCSSVY